MCTVVKEKYAEAVDKSELNLIQFREEKVAQAVPMQVFKKYVLVRTTVVWFRFIVIKA